MPDPAFLSMRASLVSRGLLTGDFRLTPAGHAHAARIVEQLMAGERTEGPAKRAVHWTVKNGGRTRG